MQPIRKVQVLSGKERFNMDHQSIPNPKCLIVFIMKTKPRCKERKTSVKKNIVKFNGRRLRRREQKYTYSVDQNLPRISSRYQIIEDQDKREKIKCLYLEMKDCNQSGLYYLILSYHCIRKETLYT